MIIDISDNPTNGEVLKRIFPALTGDIFPKYDVVIVHLDSSSGCVPFDLNWWFDSYKKEGG